MWPRIDLWGTPSLIGMSCKDFTSRSNWSLLLLTNERVKLKPRCLNLAKCIGYNSTSCAIFAGSTVWIPRFYLVVRFIQKIWGFFWGIFLKQRSIKKRDFSTISHCSNTYKFKFHIITKLTWGINNTYLWVQRSINLPLENNPPL